MKNAFTEIVSNIIPEPAKEIKPMQEKALEDISLFSGSKDEFFSKSLMGQVLFTSWQGDNVENKEWSEDSALASLRGLAPKDEMEGMIVAQMVATHQAIIECYRRAMIPSHSLEARNMNLNQASKLTRSYALLFESLNRYRGKGISQQKVTVEHVHVHAGGQAIVGNVEPKL